jgi:glycosyltransferase involved in cell wall biosynthesis
VRLLGPLPTERLRDVHGASDFFCLTPVENGSKSARRYERIYLEAAACGLPSIATPIAGAADAVIDNVTGRLVEPSIDLIADAIEELTIDGIKRMSLGKRAWMRIREMNRMSRATPEQPSLPSAMHILHSREVTRGSSDVGVLE